MHLLLSITLLICLSAGKLIVSEMVTHTDPPYYDYLEIHNTDGLASLDASGYALSESSANPTEIVLPAGTILAPG